MIDRLMRWRFLVGEFCPGLPRLTESTLARNQHTGYPCLAMLAYPTVFARGVLRSSDVTTPWKCKMLPRGEVDRAAPTSVAIIALRGRVETSFFRHPGFRQADEPALAVGDDNRNIRGD